VHLHALRLVLRTQSALRKMRIAGPRFGARKMAAKSHLSAAPNKDYFYRMMGIETPKTANSIPQVWPLSVNAYHVLGDLGLIPEKTELLYGQVFHKMPKSPFHTLLLMRLLKLLQRDLPPGLHVRPEQPILCGDSEPEPDLSVLHGSINDYAAEHPRTAELVIEVCVTSHEYDRLKLRAYARAGVKECWLVLAPEKQIEVHLRPAGEQFAESAVHGPGGSLNSAAVPSLTVDLTGLFAA
jgi:Uma2 family endonuclease